MLIRPILLKSIVAVFRLFANISVFNNNDLFIIFPYSQNTPKGMAPILNPPQPCVCIIFILNVRLLGPIIKGMQSI